jgi:hypothetical protein
MVIIIMAELKVHSRRDTLPKELVYPLKTSALAAAIQQQLVGDMHLSVSFSRTQAYWKEQRERIQEEGRYRLVKCTYYANGQHLPKLGSQPWAEEEHPQVVLAEVAALPREVLPKQASIHAVTAALVQESISQLAPQGLPMKRDRSRPHDAWVLQVEFDSPAQRLLAKLWPWDGGQFVLRTVERELTPAEVPGLEGEAE